MRGERKPELPLRDKSCSTVQLTHSSRDGVLIALRGHFSCSFPFNSNYVLRQKLLKINKAGSVLHLSSTVTFCAVSGTLCQRHEQVIWVRIKVWRTNQRFDQMT